MKKYPVLINKGNFYLATWAEFKPCFIPTVRKPDYVSDSGSKYWYTEKGVIRGADHWGGNIGSCDWFMKGDNGDFYQSSYDDDHGFRCGYCKWSDFIGGEIELYITGYELPDEFDYDLTIETEDIKDGFYILYGRKIPVKDYKSEINFDFCEKI